MNGIVAQNQSAASAKISARARTVAAALGLALLGVTLIYGVGFAGPQVIHNAAHDVRHSNGFPCH